MNILRSALLAGAILVAAAVAAPPALAADPVIGVEWENLDISVFSPPDTEVAAVMQDQKKLLCTVATTKAFDGELPLVTITYDLRLKPREARLEISSGPISVGDAKTWAKVAAYIQVFLTASDGKTVAQTLATLGKEWGYCNAVAEAHAAEISFGANMSASTKSWDTQVNFQVALSDLEFVYRMVKGGVIDLPLGTRDITEVLDVVQPLLGESLTATERGLVLLYYMFRRHADTSEDLEDRRHSAIKNGFALFPKVLVSELLALKSDDLDGKKIASFLDELELDPGFTKSRLVLVDDKNRGSFAADRFRVGVISNPIAPYLDRQGEIFFVMETRNPNDNLNVFMYPLGKNGGEFSLKKAALTSVKTALGKLKVPSYVAPSSSGCAIQ